MNRSDWERRSSPGLLALMDELLTVLKSLDASVRLNFGPKQYVGLEKGGKPNNFVEFRPQMSNVVVGVRLTQSPQTDAELQKARLEFRYHTYHRHYLIALNRVGARRNADLIRKLFKAAYDESGG
jgi:hypothetical protein